MDRFFQKRHFEPVEPPSWTAVWPQSINHMCVNGRKRPWTVPFYCFQLVLSNGVRFFSENRIDTVLHTGSVFLIEPDVPFCYHAVDDGLMHIYALRLAGPGVPAFLTQMGFRSGRITFQARDCRKTFETLEALMRLSARRDASATYLTVATLHRLPLHTGLPLEAPEQADLVTRVLDHINNHMELGENIDELSERFGVSRHTLFAKFKAKFQLSPVQILIRKRLERAQYLLRTTGFEIGDVARFSGYRSTEHFQRQFRKSCGQPPGSWRQQVMEQENE